MALGSHSRRGRFGGGLLPVQPRGASCTGAFPSAFPPPLSWREDDGDVPHPSPLRGGGGMLAEGLYPKFCLPAAAGLFPCAVRDQPPPGHGRLVLSGFRWPRGGTWAKGPSPHVCFGGVGGSGWPGCRAVLPIGSPLAGVEDVQTQRVPTAVSPREMPVLPPRRHRPRLAKVPLRALPGHRRAAAPGEARLITPRAGALVPNGTEEMRGCPRNGVRQERRRRRLEMERGAGRQRLGTGHGRGTACPPRPGGTRPPHGQRWGGAGWGGTGRGDSPSARLEMTLPAQRVVWRKSGRFGVLRE